MSNKNKLFIFLHPHRSAGTTIIEHIIEECSPEEYFFIDSKMGVSNIKKDLKTLKENKNLKFILGHESFYGLKYLFDNRKILFFTIIRDPAEKIVSMYNSYLCVEKYKKKVSFEKWYKSLEKNPQVNFYYEKLIATTESSQKLKRNKKFLYDLSKIFFNYRHSVLFFLRKMKKNYLKSKIRENEKLEEVKKLFKELIFIGFVENSKDDLKKLFGMLGLSRKWENKNKTKEHVNPPLKITPSLRKRLYKENLYDVFLYNYSIKLMKKRKIKQIPIPNPK